MATKNFELIYEMRKYHESVQAAEANVRSAEKELAQTRGTYRAMCAKLSKVPLDDLQFSDSGCLAHGIPSHVYHIVEKYQPHGSPKNKCIFCGCDNYEDLY